MAAVEKMPVSLNMAPLYLVLDDLAWQRTGRYAYHQQTLRWAAKAWAQRYPWELPGGCKTFFNLFCCIQAGHQTGKHCPWRQKQWLAPFREQMPTGRHKCCLSSFPMNMAVVRKCAEISPSSFEREGMMAVLGMRMGLETGAAREQHFCGDGHLIMEWKLPRCEDLGMVNRAVSIAQLRAILKSLLATSARLTLKVGI